MDADARIIWHLHEGRKLEAVKVHREATNSSLLQAKTEVERIESGLVQVLPKPTWK